MNSFSSAIDSQLVGLVGAIVIAILASRLVFQLLNKEAKTVLAIVVIVLLLQFGFGISPRQLWLEISHLPQEIARLAAQIA